jgi:hypothetical protein
VVVDLVVNNACTACSKELVHRLHLNGHFVAVTSVSLSSTKLCIRGIEFSD